VNEHRIRLRGGWECQAAGSAEPPETVTLPFRWDAARPRRVHLSRRFGRPKIDPLRQCLLLELDQASGIHSLLLNGKAIAAISPPKSYYLIPLPDIEDRNVLVLEVETGQARGDAFGKDPEWGRIALVIQPVE
jgi:hypothetical protein